LRRPVQVARVAVREPHPEVERAHPGPRERQAPRKELRAVDRERRQRLLRRRGLVLDRRRLDRRSRTRRQRVVAGDDDSDEGDEPRLDAHYFQNRKITFFQFVFVRNRHTARSASATALRPMGWSGRYAWP